MQSSDREQQEEMVASLTTHAQEQQHERRHAAAAASMAVQPAEVVDARLSYQTLLDARPAACAQQNGSSLGTVQAQTRHLSATVAGDEDTSSAIAGGDHRLQRRQLGRWTPDEVAALIVGVQLHGTQWSTIWEHYVVAGVINPGRSQVDLKDKWRNLVKLACNPGKQARSIDLTGTPRRRVRSRCWLQGAPTGCQRCSRAEEQRQVVRGIVTGTSGAIVAGADSGCAGVTV